jgi:hypothetical protein
MIIRGTAANAYSSINDRIAPAGKAGAGGICTLGHWRSLVSAAVRNQLPKRVASVMPVSIRIVWTPFDVWAVLFSAILASGSLLRRVRVSDRVGMCQDAPGRHPVCQCRPVEDRRGADNAAAARVWAGKALGMPTQRRSPRSVPPRPLGSDGRYEGAPDQGAQLPRLQAAAPEAVFQGSEDLGLEGWEDVD